MPVLATFGAMSARGFGFGSLGRGNAHFIGSTNQVLFNGVNAVALPAGTQVGDFLFITSLTGVAQLVSVSGAGASWPAVSDSGDFSYTGAVCASLSTILATTNNSNSCLILSVFRGPTAFSLRGVSSGSGPTRSTVPGFAKSAGSRVIVTVNATFPGGGAPVHESCTTAQFTTVQGPSNFATLDFAYAASSAYPNGRNIVWTLPGVGSGAAAWELTA